MKSFFITMESTGFQPVEEGDNYLLTHPKTAAKHIVSGWGKLANKQNPKEVIKAVEDAKKGVKAIKPAESKKPTKKEDK